MKEVTLEQFREIYFRLGGGDRAGWGQAYWDQFFANDPAPAMKYLIEEPPTPSHNRMMIVSDFAAREYRLFFMTEESEESFCEFPG